MAAARSVLRILAASLKRRLQLFFNRAFGLACGQKVAGLRPQAFDLCLFR
jgi:hypothetical protein